MNNQYNHDPSLPWCTSLVDVSLEALRARAAKLTVDQLRRYGHDYCYLNLLSLYGESCTTDEVRALSLECMRNHLLFGEEFHAYCLAARGRRTWDSEMRDFDAGIRLTAQARSTLKGLLARGSIIACGFHWSAFRFIPFGLTSLGIPAKVLLGENGVDRYGSYFEFDDIELKSMRERGVPETFYRVSTLGTHYQPELLKVLRSMKQEPAALFIPVDGMFASKGSHSLVDVTFSGMPLSVKRNPARLAAMLDMPLVALFAKRQHSGIMTIDVAEVIQPESGEQFAQTAMQRLYESLEQYVNCLPTHWEGARTFHHWRKPAEQVGLQAPTGEDLSEVRSGIESGHLSLNDSRLVRVQLADGDCAWIDSRTLRCFGRSAGAVRVLDALGDPVELARMWRDTRGDEQRALSVLRFLAQLRSQGLLRNFDPHLKVLSTSQSLASQDRAYEFQA